MQVRTGISTQSYGNFGLKEAVEIIRKLFAGEYVSYQGRHFQVERAKLYDLPDQAPPVTIAVSGPDSIRLAADHADA
jgi:alkanesulfonate monooxygenase SsuD/methylene tetrahydromethanopterin reductase-like flavin-dependent oxidoreductase (luciferase family)